MLDSATEKFGDCVERCLGFVMGGTTETPKVKIQEQERWESVDRPGGISLFQCTQNGSMGVYYDRRSFSDSALEQAYRTIEENIPIYGRQIAQTLLEPFQAHQSRKSTDSWLNEEVIRRFFQRLQSKEVATMDPDLFHVSSCLTLSANKTIQLQSANLILWPVCVDNQWFLILMQRFQNNTFLIKVLDGDNSTSRHGEIAKKGEGLLATVFGENGYRVLNDMKYSSYLVPQQDNSMDSGTTIAYYAYKALQPYSLGQYEQFKDRLCNYVQFRIHMAFEIASAAVEAAYHFVRSPSPAILRQYSKTPPPDRSQEQSSGRCELTRSKTLKVC